MPPSSETNNALSGDSTKAHTRLTFEGAMATAMRPYGFFGKPLLVSVVISVHVLPPSVDRNNPLAEGAVGPSPPERYSQPLRRKSHIAANMMSGLLGSIFTSVQPVERFAPLRTWFHVLPPSVVLRSEEHTSELQSQSNLVCRLLLEKKNIVFIWGKQRLMLPAAPLGFHHPAFPGMQATHPRGAIETELPQLQQVGSRQELLHDANGA